MPPSDAMTTAELAAELRRIAADFQSGTEDAATNWALDYGSKASSVLTLAASRLSAPVPVEVRDREGHIWSAIRGGLGCLRDDMKAAVGATRYEEESALFDHIARTLAAAVEKRLAEGTTAASPPPAR